MALTSHEPKLIQPMNQALIFSPNVTRPAVYSPPHYILPKLYLTPQTAGM